MLYRMNRGQKWIFTYSDILVSIIIVMNMALLLVLPYQSNGLITIFTNVLLLAHFLLFLSVLKFVTGNECFILAILMLFGLFNIFINGGLDGNRIKSLLLFMELPLYTIIIKHIYSDERIRSLIYKYGIAMSFVFLFFSKMEFAYSLNSEYGTVVVDTLTLGYSNRNITALMLLLILLINIVGLCENNKKIIEKILAIASVGIDLYLLLLTQNRTCIIVTIAFVILVFVNRDRRNISNKAIIICFLIPLFSMLLMLFIGPEYQDLMFLGSSIMTGREEIYRNTLSNLSITQIVFGAYSIYGLRNLVNGYLTIFASLGIVPFIVYLSMLWQMIQTLNFKQVDNRDKVAIIAICAVMIHTSTESALLVSGTYFASSFFLLMYVATVDNYQVENGG